MGPVFIENDYLVRKKKKPAQLKNTLILLKIN